MSSNGSPYMCKGVAYMRIRPGFTSSVKSRALTFKSSAPPVLHATSTEALECTTGTEKANIAWKDMMHHKEMFGSSSPIATANFNNEWDVHTGVVGVAFDKTKRWGEVKVG